MSFDGNLLYISKTNSNWTAFPLGNYAKAEDYSALWSGQDIESGRDADGNLDRNALDNAILKVEFNTIPLLTNTQLGNMFKYFSDRYIKDYEKSIWVKAYVPELDTYKSQKCYMPDVAVPIYHVNSSSKIIRYNSVRIALIGYGKG